MRNKVISVIKYTVERNIRNKWFVILNLLMFVVTVGMLNFSNIKSLFLKNNTTQTDKATQTKLNIQVIDSTSFFANELKDSIQKKGLDNKVNLNILDKVPQYTKDTIDKKTVLIEIKRVKDDIIQTSITSKEGIDIEYYDIIEEALKKVKYRIIENEYNISEEFLIKVTEPPIIHRTMLGVNDDNSNERQGIQTVLNYVIFFILLMILSKISNDISQEKLSKSIEYVLTSISAKGYLIAKVVSINVTMIIQLMFEVIYFVIGSSINSLFVLKGLGSEAAGIVGNTSISGINNIINLNTVGYISIFVFYMIVTVLIQCVIQAAFSSKTTNISEAGNSTTILVIVNMIIYFASIFVITPLKEPNAIMYILSCVPIISMYFIPTMIISSHATIIQIFIATIILIVSVPLVFNICAKAFKNGVLSYTNKKGKEKKNKKGNLTIEDVQIEIIHKKNYKKIGFVIGFSILLFIAVQLIATYIVSPIMVLFNGKFTSEEVTIITNIVVYVFSLLVPILFVYMYVRKEDRINKNKNISNTKSIFIAVPIVIFIQIILGFILEKLGMNYDITQKFDLFSGNTILSKVLYFIQIAVLPAILEELYIRGAVLNFLKKYGAKFAIVFSAILFAIIHMNISQSVFAFLVGIVFGIMTISTGSILPSCIVHFLNNGYAALTVIFSLNNNVIGIINLIYIVIFIIGSYYIIKGIVKFIKEKKKIIDIFNFKNEDDSNIIDSRGYKYMFYDYTMIIATLAVATMLLVMQNMISIL